MVAPVTTLQSVLRDQLGATATKEGCRQGGCGSCTVLRRRRARARRACCRSRTSAGRADHDARDPHAGRGPAPDPAGVHRSRRVPVRLLHAGDGHGHERAPGARPGAHDRRHPGRIERQHLPLYGLPAHRRGRRGGSHRGMTRGARRRGRAGPMTTPLNVVGRLRRTERRRRPRHRPDRVHGRPDVPGDAPPQDGPQPRSTTRGSGASTCPTPSASPGSSGP